MENNFDQDKIIKSVKALMEILPKMLETIAVFSQIKERTDEEEAVLLKLQTEVSKIKQQIEDVQLLLGKRL